MVVGSMVLVVGSTVAVVVGSILALDSKLVLLVGSKDRDRNSSLLT